MDSFEIEIDPIERCEFARRHDGQKQVPGRLVVKQSVRRKKRTLEDRSGRCKSTFNIIGP